MMTVRFSTGFSIQYNTANYVVRHSAGYADLYTKEGGQWVAQVPLDAVVESIPACRTYQAMTDDVSLNALCDQVRKLKLLCGRRLPVAAKRKGVRK